MIPASITMTIASIRHYLVLCDFRVVNGPHFEDRPEPEIYF